MLFDSGSQQSFIPTSITYIFKDGRSAKQERLGISGFVDRGSRETNCSMHDLEVKSIKEGETIQVIVAKVPVISRELRNKHFERVKRDYTRFERL